MLLLLAASVIGLPPLPGFLGKLMILQAAAGARRRRGCGRCVLRRRLPLAAGPGARRQPAVLGGRAGARRRRRSGASPRLLLATLSLLGAVLVMTVAAAPLKRYTDAAARQLVDVAGAAPRRARAGSRRRRGAALPPRGRPAGRTSNDEAASVPAPRPRRWLAHPWLSAVRRACGWLLLQGSLAPVHWFWARACWRWCCPGGARLHRPAPAGVRAAAAVAAAGAARGAGHRRRQPRAWPASCWSPGAGRVPPGCGCRYGLDGSARRSRCSPPSSPPRPARCPAWSRRSAARSWCTRWTRDDPAGDRGRDHGSAMTAPLKEIFG